MTVIKRLLVFLLLVCVSASFIACGNKKDEEILDSETRTAVTALEGRDYTIDYIKVSVADYKEENGQVIYMSYGELRDEVARRKELGEEIHFRITVKFTAINELSSASVGLNLQFWSFNGGSETKYCGDSMGNRIGYSGETFKSMNILPGTHYLHFDVDIDNEYSGYSDVFIIENLDALDEDLTYKFYAYQ